MPYVNTLDATCGGIVRVCMCACAHAYSQATKPCESLIPCEPRCISQPPPPSPCARICLQYNRLTSCSFLTCPCRKLTSSSLVSSRCTASPLASAKWKHGFITLRASTTIFSTKTQPCAQSFSAKESTLWSSLPRRSSPWWTPTPTPARAVTNRQQARVRASSAARGNWRWLWKVAAEGGVQHSHCSCRKHPHAPQKLSPPRRSVTWLWSEWREEVGARVEASPSPFCEKRKLCHHPGWSRILFWMYVCVCESECMRERERELGFQSALRFSHLVQQKEGQNACIIPDQIQLFTIEWWLTPWG